MSYKIIEVELENGVVHPAVSETLPAKAHALLTIPTPAPAAPADLPTGSLADLLPDFCGIGNGAHTDLSTNQRHLDDLGK